MSSVSERYFDELLRDPDLARLDAIVPPFDPLEVLAFSRRERPHTRFLAWLLDPREPRPGGGHGQGAAFLQMLVRHAQENFDTLPGEEIVDLPREGVCVDPATVEVIRERAVGDGIRLAARAPDIRVTWRELTTGRPWLLVIENKIGAAEGDGQVKEYLAWGRTRYPDAQRLLLYITPDGHAPVSRTDGEAVVPLAWTDIGEILMKVIVFRDRSMDDRALTFVLNVGMSLSARFGGTPDVRTLIMGLHTRHSRACALIGSPALESSALDALRSSHPCAVWHLQNAVPRKYPWTVAWTEGVAQSFANLPSCDGCHDPWPVLRPGAPHAGCRDLVSWSLEGLTQTLGIYAFCTPGHGSGGARTSLWLGILGPGVRPSELFERRDQSAVINALPDATRRWLMEATPVEDRPGVWRWLRVGNAVPLPRGWSPGDDANRVAQALAGLISPYMAALETLVKDPDQRLFSCDLDADHGLPIDTRDRASLDAQARPDAQQVVIAVLRPRRHFHEGRHESDLGLALGAAFGGTGSLRYRYAESRDAQDLDAQSVVAVATGHLRGARNDIDVLVERAISVGATVLLLGELRRPEASYVINSGELLRIGEGRVDSARILVPLTVKGEHFRPADESIALTTPLAAFAEVCAKGGQLIDGALRSHVEAATVAVWCTLTDGPDAGDRFPLVAGWRVGNARVIWWAGGGYGVWAQRLFQRPEVFGPWWRAMTAFASEL